jgi:hypothetical protein
MVSIVYDKLAYLMGTPDFGRRLARRRPCRVHSFTRLSAYSVIEVLFGLTISVEIAAPTAMPAKAGK